MSDPMLFHCRCGATRPGAPHLRVLSCIKCGRELFRQVPQQAPVPSRSIVAIATFVSQLLGAVAFAFASVWIARYGARDAIILTIGALGALGVFAGGHAHRGNVTALVLCAFLDIAIAGACLAKPLAVVMFVGTPLAWAMPVVLRELSIALAATGALAVLAAAACVAAIPQTRRFFAWRAALVLRTARLPG